MHQIDLIPSYRDTRRLEQLRKRAKRLGFKLSKSRWRQPYVKNYGGLILLSGRNKVVAGDGYSLDLASVERILSAKADQMSSSMPRSVEQMRG